MFCLRRPDDCRIRQFLAGQQHETLSYGLVGCTGDDHAGYHRPGWSVDHHRVLLGHGTETFCRARAAIEAWQMFPAETTSVFGRAQPKEGLDVAVLFHAWPLALWLLMPARVVYIVNESVHRSGRQIDRYGFAYGTLPDHPERGEERFLVEWNHADDNVHYDLLAISQPRHWLVRLGYPYTRQQQARFRRLSGLAMQQAVA
jgi:uncharacterized protein (UPF0548 family)